MASGVGILAGDTAVDLMQHILTGDLTAAIGQLAESYTAGRELGAVLDQLLGLIRDMLLVKTSKSDVSTLLSPAYSLKTVQRLCEGVPASRLLAYTGILQEALTRMPHAANRRIEAELCVVRLCQLTAEDFTEHRPRGIIGMVNGEITTTDAGYSDRIDVEYDVLKIAVVERHKNTHHIGIGFLQGYGLKSGAVATSISHDSHNIIVVGTNEADMAAAVNRVVELNGGIVVWDGGAPAAEVPLAIAGIMSDEPLVTVNEKLEDAKEKAYALGVSRGIDPFMTLSFMALPVIPSLRITTRGVFDVGSQSYV